MFEDNLNVPINPYKQISRDNVFNKTENATAEKKTPAFSEFFQVPNGVKESVYFTLGVSIE